MDADKPKTYAKLHGTEEKDFNKLINNLETLVEVRNKYSTKCTLGAQLLLFKSNINEVYPLAERLEKIGMDYLVVKPFTDHQYREGNVKKEIKYNEMFDKLNVITNSNTFKLIIRDETFKRLEIEREYNKCNALDFWSYISANGDVYSCSNFLGNKDYSYGNIYNDSFENIWKNRKQLDINIRKDCRLVCRMDKINEYLWQLKHPHSHVNFI